MAVTLLRSLARPNLPSSFPYTNHFSRSPQTVSFYLSHTLKIHTHALKHTHTQVKRGGTTSFGKLGVTINPTKARACDPPPCVRPFLHLSVPPSLLRARSLGI